MSATVEQLEKDLAAEKAKSAQLEADLKAVQGTSDALAKSNTELVAANNDLVKELADVKAENELLQGEVNKLLETPDEEEEESGVGKTFEFEGKKYKVLVPSLHVPGVGKIEAIALLTDPKAQAILVKNKSSVIKALK